jgi:ATP/maltotriose-dependent transcriptional regulator MalT/DNA-binding SARP family transcriptional activator
MPPLIKTKIRVPRRRSDLLPRRRLVDFVHAHLDRKLILVSAPAGYGKTSLLSDFADDTDLPVCWYTLDPFDRDPRVFIEYLIAAISRQFPDFGERSRTYLRNVTDPGRSLYPMVATLVQEIYDAIPEYFVLVLDDHQCVEDQDQISEFLDLFVTYVDENCHLIIASRGLPALPNLSLLVARRQAAGLSIDELRFTPREVQALAQQNYNLALSSEQADVLVQRTGGWITGLLLTAVPRWEQALQEVPIQGRINVGLYDYLSKQVLEQQPAPLRDFLLASSVLDELSPELCTAVLGIEQPASLMDGLQVRNLFVVEFEGSDYRLRYHDLFRDFLRSDLRRKDEPRFRQLTQRAAEVYAERGEWEQAVSRYLVLGQYEPVVEILQQTATNLFESGRWDTLASWIDALPAGIHKDNIDFMVHRAKIHIERGEHAPAFALCERAERAFAAADDSAGIALILATKSSLLRFQGRYPEAIENCEQALKLASGNTKREESVSALAYKDLGLCQLRLGQLAESEGALQQALHLFEAIDAPYDVGMAHHDLGLVHELRGDLEGAVGHYQAALQYWRKLGNPGPLANTLNGLGVVFYLQGAYDEAQPILTEALTQAQQAGDLRVEAYTWASLGDLHRDLRTYKRAQEAYAQALEVAARAQVGFITTYALDALGNILRLLGNFAQASKRLLEALEHAQEHKSTYEIGLCHTSLGTLASEEGDLQVARHHLDRAIERFEAGGFARDLARACLHHAQVSYLARDPETALTNLERALALAAQLGHDQFLVVDGQQLQPLLRYAADQGVGADILPRFLKRIATHKASHEEHPEPAVQVKPQPALAIHALGQPSVEKDGEGVQWAVAQSRDLFFCLLQHPRGLRKEEIGRIFWPDHAPPKLDGIFRSTLYRLRRAIFRESILFAEGRYRFNRESDYWFDAEIFEELLDRAEQSATSEERMTLLEEALSLYRGDYLEGVYADWCALERERLQGRYLAALDTLASLYADRRELQPAVDLYQRLLTQDPYQEVAHRELMRCYYRLGDRASAIRQYQICTDILREDLGLSPALETETLYLRIIG